MSDVQTKETADDRKIFGNGLQLDHLLPKQTYHSLWESPEAFARYIETITGKSSWCEAGLDKGDESFYGTKTMEDALVLAKNGWTEGAEKVEALRSRIAAANPKAPKLIQHGIAGATPNVARAVAGNIFNMRVPDASKSHKKPVITLMANMSANCMISKDSISNRAAVICALVDEIENSGYSCEVIATAMSRGSWNGDSNFKAATSVIIKASHQPVDIKKLAFGIGHASMFRRLIFADWGSEKRCKSGLGHGLGNAGCGFKEEEKEMLDKGIYLLPSAETRQELFKDDATSMEQGLPYIMQFLKEKGCPPFRYIKDWKDPKGKKNDDPDMPEYDED
jgi:hypothetical protein